MRRLRRGVACTAIFAIMFMPVAIACLTNPSTAAAAGPWILQNSGTGRTLQDVACPIRTRCYAVGNHATIRVTKNGGNTWTGQSNPLSGTSRVLVRLRCPNVTTCYVVAPPATVLVTKNGGASWSSRTVPLSGATSRLNDIACIGPNTCYVVAAPNAVFLTTNSGVTWTAQTIPPTVPCEGSCGSPNIPYSLQWIRCPTGSTCRAGGSVFIGSHEGFADAVIATTAIGAAWTTLTTSFAPNTAVCPTVSRCYGLYADPFANAAGNNVWISTSGGTSWTGKNSGTTRFLNDVACPKVNWCYVVGNTGTIVRTTNGSTFAPQTSPTFRNLFGVACAAVRTCWAVGRFGTIIALRG